MNAAETPGYSIRLTIRLKTGRSGRKMAHRWSPDPGGRADMTCPGTGRWLRMKLVDAELLIAQEMADQYDASLDPWA